MRAGVLLLLLCSRLASSQPVTFFKDIQPILIKNCSECHRPGGIGPFSLQTYEEVSSKGKFVAHVTQTKYMPPWKADPSFRSFRNERTLLAADIELIDTWVKAGMPKGKKVKQKITLVANHSPKPDLSIPMTSNYAISDKGVED
ncbi:MAG: cytochrome c, partial [Cyclobacteriaceae bacterium]|nr:cytochrome c [Cyclobacteriaceae bacterium]